MTTYSDAHLKAHLTRICISAADELTGGTWREGMRRTAQWEDLLALSGMIGNVVKTFGGLGGTLAAAGAIGVSLPMFLSLVLKRPVAWIQDVISGNRNHARPSPYVDVERYPDEQGNPGTDKWGGMNPDDFNRVPDGFYNPNTGMSQDYFDSLKTGYQDYRGRFGLPTNVGTSPGSFGGVGVAPSIFSDTMNSVTPRTRRASSKKLVRLAQANPLLTRGLSPAMLSQVSPQDNMQMATQGAFQGWYTPGGRGDGFVDAEGQYGRSAPVEWQAGGNRLETMRNRMLAMRQSNMDRISYQTAFSLGQIANYVQSGRMSPEKASMAVEGIRYQLIYGEGFGEAEADAIMDKARQTNYAGSVPERNTGAMGRLPGLSEQQWNSPTDPTNENSWYAPAAQRMNDVMGDMRSGAPGASQIERYRIPGFNSDNNFMPL